MLLFLINALYAVNNMENELIDKRWYWVTLGDGFWFPALRDKTASGGWTNTDTWEDFFKEVTEFKLIPLPNEL